MNIKMNNKHQTQLIKNDKNLNIKKKKRNKK